MWVHLLTSLFLTRFILSVFSLNRTITRAKERHTLTISSVMLLGIVKEQICDVYLLKTFWDWSDIQGNVLGIVTFYVLYGVWLFGKELYARF